MPVFSFRFRAILILAAVAAAVIGLVVWNSLPDPGIREFQQAQQALSKVRSWRMRDVRSSTYESTEMLYEIVCPGDQHLTVTRKKYNGEILDIFENFFVAGSGYHFNKHSKSWEISEDAEGPSSICERLMRGEDSHPFPPFAHLLKRGTLRKGELKTIEGVQCREWTVKVFQVSTYNEDEEICIGVKDNLPVQRASSQGKYLFSDWNAPMEIKVPTVAPPSQE